MRLDAAYCSCSIFPFSLGRSNMTQKRYKVRTSAVVLFSAVMLGSAAVGVHASEPCQRFIQRVVYKAVPHHYSKTTLARWAEWGKAHPNYHPPKRRPAMKPQEVADKVNFACTVDPEPVLVAGLLQNNLPPEPPELSLTPTFLTVNTAPLPPGSPVSLVNLPPSAPPISVGDVPEPQSWIFGATGLAFLCFCVQRRKKSAISVWN